jgi:hypothetical protein
MSRSFSLNSGAFALRIHASALGHVVFHLFGCLLKAAVVRLWHYLLTVP